jgi:hypothetical protein
VECAEKFKEAKAFCLCGSILNKEKDWYCILVDATLAQVHRQKMFIAHHIHA